jgi:hypothetical protein
VIFAEIVPVPTLATCAGNDLHDFGAWVSQETGCDCANNFVAFIDGDPDLYFVVEGLFADIESSQFVYAMF